MFNTANYYLEITARGFGGYQQVFKKKEVDMLTRRIYIFRAAVIEQRSWVIGKLSKIADTNYLPFHIIL